MDTIDSAMYRRLSCLKTAPLGLPVVPEEYRRVAMSAEANRSLDGRVLSLPLERNSSQEITFSLHLLAFELGRWKLLARQR